MSEDMSLAKAIGEVQGTLKALVDITQQNNRQINQRIDDLADAVNRRIGDTQKVNDHRFKAVDQRLEAVEKRLDTTEQASEDRKHDGKKALGSGGLAGIIVAVGVELTKTGLGAQ